MRADDQRGLAALDGGRHLVAFLLLLAAREPGHAQAALGQQRIEPADQLAEVLGREDFGGRHQRALEARVDAARRGQRRDHGLARAHVALQQAVHRDLAVQVGRDLLAHTLLRTGEAEGQHGEQLCMQ
ncbi:hypothetical protein D9M68_388930 [compost metagenome]